MKFDFYQHVSSWEYDLNVPEFLAEEFRSIFNHILEIYDDSSKRRKKSSFQKYMNN